MGFYDFDFYQFSDELDIADAIREREEEEEEEAEEWYAEYLEEMEHYNPYEDEWTDEIQKEMTYMFSGDDYLPRKHRPGELLEGYGVLGSEFE